MKRILLVFLLALGCTQAFSQLTLSTLLQHNIDSIKRQPTSGLRNYFFNKGFLNSVIINQGTNTLAGNTVIDGSSSNNLSVTNMATLFLGGSNTTINGANSFTSSSPTYSFTATSSVGINVTSGAGISLSTTAGTFSGKKFTFTPTSTISGLNVGSLAGNPSTPANGDIWYNSTGNVLNAQINGSTVSLGAGGGGGATSVSSSNGFAGSVTSSVLTMTTSITGLLKGNGTAISAIVSGTDIKTVAGTTLIGSGDLGVIPGQYGGTGVANTGKTITIAGNLTTTGAFATTFAVTGANTITFPNASITVARSDAAQTFTGVQTFSAAPVFSTSFTLPNGTIATTQTAGDNSTKVATTAYVATAAGGAGSGAIGTVLTGTGSSSAFAPSNEPIGDIYSVNSTAGTIAMTDYINTGSATASVSGGTMNISGGTVGTLTNAIHRNISVAYDWTYQKVQFKINASVTGESVGIGLYPISSSGLQIDEKIFINTAATTNRGQIKIHSNNFGTDVVVATSSINLTYTNGDLLEAYINYQNGTTDVTIRNLTTLTNSPVYLSYSTPNTNITTKTGYFTLCQPAFYAMGGTWSIVSDTYGTNYKYGSVLARVGDSITEGWLSGNTNGAFTNSELSLDRTSLNGDIMGYACGGSTSLDILNSIATLVAARPKYVVMMIGTNDVVFSVSLGTTTTPGTYLYNVQNIITTLIQNRIVPIIMYITPSANSGVQSTNDTWNAALTSNFGTQCLVYDWATQLKSGGTLASAYDCGDGTHLTAAAHQLLWKSLLSVISIQQKNVSSGSSSISGLTAGRVVLSASGTTVNDNAGLDFKTSQANYLNVIINTAGASSGYSATNTSSTGFAQFSATSDASSGVANVSKIGSTFTTYKTIHAGDMDVYNASTLGNISILNDYTSGNINFTAGGSSSPHLTILTTGQLQNSFLATGTKLLLADASGNIGPVTLGTGLSFSGTTLNGATGTISGLTTNGSVVATSATSIGTIAGSVWSTNGLDITINNGSASTHFGATNSNAGGYTTMVATNDAGALFELGKSGSTAAAIGPIASSDALLYNNISGNITILNAYASGNINMTAGNGSTAQFILGTTGAVTIAAMSTAGIVTNSSAGLLSSIASLSTVLGGTGQTVYAVGDILYASTTTALSKLADVAAGSYLRSGGVSTAPLWSTLILPNAATANQIVYATATNTYGASANFTFTGSALSITGTETNTMTAQASGQILQTYTNAAHTAGVQKTLLLTGAAYTGITTTAESVEEDHAYNQTKTWATGTVGQQRHVIFRAPTYAAAAASTFSSASFVDITGAPVAGTNATLTFSSALNVEGGAVGSGVGTAYGINVSAPTGATTNVALNVAGKITTTSTTASTGTNTAFSIGTPIMTGGTPTVLKVSNNAHTGLTASTEASDIIFSLTSTEQFATGSLALQRAVQFTSPTYAFVGASTLTLAANISNSGPPNGGTNATITTSVGENVETRSLTNVTNGYAAFFNAPTGATTNYALGLNGNMVMTTAGNGLLVKQGTNATFGQATLSAGTVTVNTTKATSTCSIFFSHRGSSNVGTLSYTVTAGTSFTVTSSAGTDANIIDWFIIETAP